MFPDPRLQLLQEYTFICLDIFKETMENKPIESELEAWLSFLSFDDPERIIELFEHYPEFKAMYQEIYAICQNTEEVMQMYSKELAELDRNTVKLMMDEMQDEINQTRDELTRKNAEISTLKEELARLRNANDIEKRSK